METMTNELFAEVLGFFAIWLILAIIIEESIGLLFNWRIFKQFSKEKGWKVPIVFFVSLAFCFAYGVDLITEVLQIFGILEANADKHIIGYVITAAFLGGGSGTVYRTIDRIRKARRPPP